MLLNPKAKSSESLPDPLIKKLSKELFLKLKKNLVSV